MLATKYWILRLLIAAVCALPLAASATCVISPGKSDDRFAPAAGCLVKHQHRMLLVRHRLSGRIGVPAGFSEHGEHAQCAAHRETVEETGLDVVVAELLKVFANGFHLYRCELAVEVSVQDPPVPQSGLFEVSAVTWRDPRGLNWHEWRFPREVPILLRLFDAL